MDTILEKSKFNYHSQYGEDGLIEKIFKILKTNDKWCVEFGAWDGVEFSNTRHLLTKKNWNGVLIEPHIKRFQILADNYKNNSKVELINKYIQFEGKDTLDKILRKTNVPKYFDILSIDIDGNDYHIWNSIKNYQPKVIVIEYNPTIPPEVEFVQPRNKNVNQGSSILSLSKLGKEKGYELIACTDANAIFVDKKYFNLFKIDDNSPEKLMPKGNLLKIFQLFDGTIVLRGYKRLIWHGIDFTDDDFQLLPGFLRRFPGWKMLVLVKAYKRDWRWFINNAKRLNIFKSAK